MSGEQKFWRGHRVKVADKLRTSMSHFRAGCEAIVVYSYDDVYGGGAEVQYRLLLETPYGISSSAWYPQECLSLVSSDRDAGEALLQEYKGA